MRSPENKVDALYELTHKSPGTVAVGWLATQDIASAQSVFARALQGC